MRPQLTTPELIKLCVLIKSIENLPEAFEEKADILLDRVQETIYEHEQEVDRLRSTAQEARELLSKIS